MECAWAYLILEFEAQEELKTMWACMAGASFEGWVSGPGTELEGQRGPERGREVWGGRYWGRVEIEVEVAAEWKE